MILWMWMTPAWACGGFFCDNVDPVVQESERILFRQEQDGWTAFVEVAFQGPPSSFGWVLPVPSDIDPETIEVAPPGLFDALEAVTAPRFVRPGVSADAAHAEAGSGCSGGCGAFDDAGFGDVVMPDTRGVKVVGEAEVGPYAIELITAKEGDNLANWLGMNGYQIPRSAADPMQLYIDEGWSFLGLKLQTDTQSGPIDTLVLHCGADRPRIPLVMTSVAAAQNMEITAYVLADRRYEPANWAHMGFHWGGVSLFDDGSTNYDALLVEKAAAAGRAWNTEFAMTADVVYEQIDPELHEALGTRPYLTRFRTYVSPENMTSDPTWKPMGRRARDVSPSHVVDAPVRTGGLALLGLLALGVWRRR